jgi:uncharacterized RDD family membrane protein YckC
LSETEITPLHVSAPRHHGAQVQAPARGTQSWRTGYLGYASIWSRVGAYLIDCVVITFLTVLVGIFLQETAPRLLDWLAFRGPDERFDSVWFILAAVYFVGLEATGATLGKRRLQIRVIQETGKPMTVWASLLRNILRPVDLTFFGLVGLLFVSTSDQWQRLGDRAARTIVVQIRPQ